MLAIALKLRKQAAYKRCEPTNWKHAKHQLFKWGKNQCMKHLLKDKAINLLEVIISLTNLKLYSQATIQAIQTTYNKKHPNNPISRDTLYRYLRELISHKLIKRFDQFEWNKSVITKVLAPKLANTSVLKQYTNNLSPDKLLPEGGGALAALPLAPSFEEKNVRPINKDDLKQLLADLKGT